MSDGLTRKPFLCRVGVHTSTYINTVGKNYGTETTPIIFMESSRVCNFCGENLGPA